MNSEPHSPLTRPVTAVAGFLLAGWLTVAATGAAADADNTQAPQAGPTEAATAQPPSGASDTEFFVQNAQRPGVVALPGGAQGLRVRAGEGASAQGAEMVVLNLAQRDLRAAAADVPGELQARLRKGQRYTLSQLPAPLAAAVHLMQIGDTWEVYVPAADQHQLRHHDAGAISLPRKACIFTVELLAAH